MLTNGKEEKTLTSGARKKFFCRIHDKKIVLHNIADRNIINCCVLHRDGTLYLHSTNIGPIYHQV